MNESQHKIYPALIAERKRMRRASNVPLYAQCAAAAYGENDAVVIHRVDEAGTFGVAVHEAGAGIVRGIEFDTGALAARYGLDDASKRRMLYQIGVLFRWWSRNGEAFCKDEGILRVIDWKSTRLKDVSYDEQCWGYLHLGVSLSRIPNGIRQGVLIEEALCYGDDSGHPDVMFVPSGEIVGCQYAIVFLEDATHTISGTKEKPYFKPEEVIEHHVAYVQSIEDWDGRTYHPGSLCHYCGRSSVCPERQTYLANTVRKLGLPSLDAMRDIVGRLSDAECVKAWDPIGMAIQVLEEARGIIKFRAVAQGNVLQGDGRKLVIEEQIRHPLKALEAWPVLQKYLTDAELAPAVSISKTVALGAIAAKAPRGQKGKIKVEVEAELDAVGALGEERILFPRLVPSLGASAERLIEGS